MKKLLFSAFLMVFPPSFFTGQLHAEQKSIYIRIDPRSIEIVNRTPVWHTTCGSYALSSMYETMDGSWAVKGMRKVAIKGKKKTKIQKLDTFEREAQVFVEDFLRQLQTAKTRTNHENDHINYSLNPPVRSVWGHNG